MNQIEIKEKLFDRIRPLVSESIQAIDITNWYVKLGPTRLVTILKELMAEDKRLSESTIAEHKHKVNEIEIAKQELEKVVGE